MCMSSYECHYLQGGGAVLLITILTVRGHVVSPCSWTSSCLHCDFFSPGILGSEVAEDLLFLAPVHRRRSLLVAAG